MDAARWQSIQALFEDAVDLPQAKRRQYLEQACADDRSLIAEVEAMLAADEAANHTGDELAWRITRSVETELQTVRLEVGQQVGAWTIDRLLATGGMGAVYLARRSDQVFEQQVVIKVVALPLSDELHQRFRRERQILADLAHPYIARLLDGGSLPGGEPYLVMEYVRGCDIATWCNDQAVALDARLDLFRQVCEAVQFAHGNLVIHRDIKPANVLVDESATPRLLDFGIASLSEAGSDNGQRDAADNRLSSDYASPEQRRGEAVTTASDVYGLGALLYRLLTDRAPGNASSVSPLSKSERCSALVGRARIELADLEAIVGKALADGPGDRYPTPQALAEDIRRCQSRQPTRARPQGRWGRLTLAMHRNPVFSATLTGSALLLLAFVVSVSWLAVYLDRERDRALAATATAEQMVDFAFSLFEGADPESGFEHTPTARDLLDQGTVRIEDTLSGQDPIRARLMHRMGKAYQGLAHYEQAEKLLASALERVESGDKDLYWRLMVDLADIERLLGRFSEAEVRLEAVVAALQNTTVHTAQLASAYNNLGILAADQEQFERAETLARQALAVSLPDSAPVQVLHDRYRHNLARTLGRQGRHTEAIDLLEGVIESKHESLGEPHPSTIRSLEVMAASYRELGQLDQAISVYEEIIAQTRAIHGEPSAAEARLYNGLANVHHDRGDYARARQAYEQALAFHDASPDVNPVTHAHALNNLASLHEDRGNLAQAEVLFRRSLDLRQELASDNSLFVAHARANLARVLVERGELGPARALMDKVDVVLSTYFPDNQLRRLRLDRQYALLDLARGELESSQAGLEAVLARLERDQPGQTGLRAIVKLDIARVHIQRHAHDQAIELIDEALGLFAEIRPPDHPHKLRAGVMRAEALAGLDRGSDAVRQIEPYLPMLVERFSADSRVIDAVSRLTARP